jgi:hypothetical protein
MKERTLYKGFYSDMETTVARHKPVRTIASSLILSLLTIHDQRNDKAVIAFAAYGLDRSRDDARLVCER